MSDSPTHVRKLWWPALGIVVVLGVILIQRAIDARTAQERQNQPIYRSRPMVPGLTYWGVVEQLKAERFAMEGPSRGFRANTVILNIYSGNGAGEVHFYEDDDVKDDEVLGVSFGPHNNSVPSIATLKTVVEIFCPKSFYHEVIEWFDATRRTERRDFGEFSVLVICKDGVPTHVDVWAGDAGK